MAVAACHAVARREPSRRASWSLSWFSTVTVEAAVQEDIFIFNLCVRLLTVGLERLLEGQLAEDYRWLLSRYPAVRRIWVVEPYMRVDRDQLLGTSAELGFFLLNSRDLRIADSDFDQYMKELESRLVPLLENGVLGYCKPLGLSQYGAVHSGLTPS